MQQKTGEIASSSANAATAAAAAVVAGGGATLSDAATQRLQENQKLSTTSTSNDLIRQLLEDMRQIEDTVDSIEIPARGRCRVFMAKYCYDPFKQSPNDNPDAELAFNAGDYIMVFDFIDEDGYFIGELMDGRRGYVPSNWLDRLTGEDLFDFQANVLYKQAGVNQSAVALGGGHLAGGNQLLNATQQSGGPGGAAAAAASLASSLLNCGVGGGVPGGGLNASTLINANLLLDEDALDNGSYPPEFYDALIADTMNHSNFQHLLAPEDYHRMNDYVDLDDVNEVDDECLSDYERAEAEQMRRAVPPPQRLLLERQLNKCILIAWLHPQTAKGTIVSYQVYVDGVLKSTVPSGDRTKALLEGVDSNIPHRISVRAIDINGRHSNDAGCTIVIGQEVPFAPSCVKASHITSDSALISWLPCNSNFHHVVAVNSVEVQTVRPGVYKHLINGLSANTLYRVWVRAKPGKILSIDENNFKKLESLTTYVDFKTMPKSLPDPPVNVQVEAGPQRRTLLVTWLPLTLNDFGSSNGCAVTGYAVFAGHKKLADIDSPTGDHALLDICDLECLHKKCVTVRTKSGENLSQDSMPCHIPDEYLKVGHLKDMHGQGGAQQQHGHHPHHHHHHHVVSSSSAAVAAAAGQRYNHHPHAHSSSSGISHSPSRQRMMMANRASGATNSRYGNNSNSAVAAAAAARNSRPLARSMQNLESDLDSRRSSIPAIEITRETSGSELVNQTESYSEEEFENSMRFRGASHRGKVAGGGGGGRVGSAGMRHFRARQSHSVDGQQQQQQHHARADPNQMTIQQQQQQQMLQMNRQYQSQASLANQQQQQQQQQRLRGGGATPMGDIRYFVALFDYDPSTMSPNPNAAAEELAFKEGSIIKVYGGLGDDGFYKGEIDNQTGFVPCNVITEITDPNLLNSLYEKNQLVVSNNGQKQQSHQQSVAGANTSHGNQQRQAMNNVQQQQQQPMNPLDHKQQQQQQLSQGQQQQQQSQGGAVKRMVALYDYDPQENSPNADTESEIPFKTGDIIFVYGKMDTDGFYMGEVERTKQRGLVPSNFLREEPLQANMKQQQQQQQFQNNPNAMQIVNQQLRSNQYQGAGNVPITTIQQHQLDNMNAGGGVGVGAGANNQMNAQQQMQMQHQHQLRAAGLIRGQPQQQPQQPQQNLIPNQANIQQQQQNINRPNSLSLMNNNQQQQQQQQMAAMNLQNQQMAAAMQAMPNGAASMANLQHQQNNPNAQLMQQLQANQLGMSGMNAAAAAAMVNNQQMGAVNQFIAGGGGGGGAVVNNQSLARANVNGVGAGNMMGQQQPQRGQIMNPQQQQQQQQQMLANQQQQPIGGGAGGVLSNLLSSGKQMIGAATTPRMPNQPGGAYPGSNQMVGAGAGLMGGANTMGGSGVPNANAMMPGQVDHTGNYMGPNRMGNNAMMQQQQQQQQPQEHPGSQNAFGQAGNIAGSVGVGGDLMQQHGHNSFPIGMGGGGGGGAIGGPTNIGGGVGGGMMGNQQPQYNQGTNFGRLAGPAGTGTGMTAMGEEQGGNILNTVKNMFKL